jgi:hypothetical protein
VLSAYAAYYNQARTHLALQKVAPLKRSIQRVGRIAAIPVLATNTSGYDFRKGQEASEPPFIEVGTDNTHFTIPGLAQPSCVRSG